MDLKELCRLAKVDYPLPPRSLTYEEYCRMMKVAVPHGPDEACTCDGCHDGKTGCKGRTHGCTCDVDWDLAMEIRDYWYADA